MSGMSYDHMQGDPKDADDLFVTNKAGDMEGKEEGPMGMKKSQKSKTVSMYLIPKSDSESY
jgi:hypothetical protein